MLLGRTIAVKLSWSLINDWAKFLDAGGQVATFILNFEKPLTLLLMASEMHSVRTIAMKLSWSLINDWAKILDAGGQVATFILKFEKPLTLLLMASEMQTPVNGAKSQWAQGTLHCSRSTVVFLVHKWHQVTSWLEQKIIFVCSLMTVSAIVRLIALKTHRNSKRILINLANGPENGVRDFSPWNVSLCSLLGSGSKRSMQFTP